MISQNPKIDEKFYPAPSVQRRPPKPRAFAGLVGRASADDLSNCTVEEIIKIKNIPPSVVQEVREAEANARAGVFDFDKAYADAMVHFQQYAFDPGLRGVKSHHWEGTPGGHVSSSKSTGTKGALADQETADEFDRLFDGHTSAETGIAVFVAPIASCPGPRLRTPWWIANEKVFHEFLLELVNQKSDAEDVFLRGKKLIQAAGLDFIILYEFYFLRKEDEQIFASHKGEFAKESGKQRATSSAAAVKMRRTRLVKEGVEMFGRGIRPVAGPEHAEHLAHWAEIRLAPDVCPRKTEKS